MGTDKQIKKVAKAVVKADKALTHTAAGHRNRPAVKLAGWAAELADQPPLIALSLATVGVGIVTRRGELVKGGARMLAAHLVTTGLKAAVKGAVDRARPGHALDTGDERFEKGDGVDDTRLNSFPSGHTAGAVAVARAAAHEIPTAGIGGALASAAVAAIQPAAGKHYMVDTIAGGAIGWASEAIVSAVFDRVEPVVERWLAGATSPARS